MAILWREENRETVEKSVCSWGLKFGIGKRHAKQE
jgi:hypothetical protein